VSHRRLIVLLSTAALVVAVALITRRRAVGHGVPPTTNVAGFGKQYLYRGISTQSAGQTFYLGPNGMRFTERWSEPDKIGFSQMGYPAMRDFLSRLASLGASPVDPNLSTNVLDLHTREQSGFREYFRFFIDGEYQVHTLHTDGIDGVVHFSRKPLDANGNPQSIDALISYGDTNAMAVISQKPVKFNEDQAKTRLTAIYDLLDTHNGRLVDFRRIKKGGYDLPFYEATFSLVDSTTMQRYGNQNYPNIRVVIDGDGKLASFNHRAYQYLVKAAKDAKDRH
jgi:hypothetical protein